MGAIKKTAKALAPPFIWRQLKVAKRYIQLSREARHFYDMYYRQQVENIRPTVLNSRETNNFTYELHPRNLSYLAEMVACATGQPSAVITAYIEEAINDQVMNQAVADGEMGGRSFASSPFGRRLGWYAIARTIKPKLIVETGVERGHGSVILCGALLRNAAEGYPGRYFGTDLNPQAGRLLKGPYATVGKVLYGDSITTLKGMTETIDLFINDSDHSDDYEMEEYRTIAPKLSDGAFILADNAHTSDKLAVFSRENGRHFLYFQEAPINHWYPGSGIGISFP
jgi:predicted O-methyltransferase YrrM